MKNKLIESPAFTHAQNRMIRRQNNAQLHEMNPTFGQPIVGKLSEVEREHAARRRERRPIILSKRIKNLELHVMTLVNRINERETAIKAPDITAKQGQILKQQIKALYINHADVLGDLQQLRYQLSKVLSNVEVQDNA